MIYRVKQNILLKLNPLVSFSSFNVAPGKLKMTRVAHILFLLDSAGLACLDSMAPCSGGLWR